MSEPGVSPTVGTRPRVAVVVSCLALFTDMFVYGVAIPVLPLLPATVDAGPTATGMLFAAYALAAIVTTPLAGRLVDRRGPRRPLLIGLVGLAAATLLFSVGAPFALLVVARVLQGVAGGMSWVAGLALIAASTPTRTRGRSMGVAMSMVSVGVLVGPPVSGVLVAAFGTHAPFLVAAAIALADGVVRLVLVRDAPPLADEPGGTQAVLRVRGTASVLGVVVVGAGTLSVIEPILPLHLADAAGLGPATIGLLFAVIVLAGVVGMPLVGATVGRIDARLLVAAGAVLAAAGLALLARGTGTTSIVIALVLLGASNAFLLAPATTLIGFQGMRADPPVLGASYATFNLAYAGGLFVGPLLGGAVTGAGGFDAAVLAAAAVTIVAVALALPRLPVR